MKIISALSSLLAATVITGSALACHDGPGGKAHFDTNQDGKVSLTEALDGAKKKFESRDKDKNGTLSGDELKGRGERRMAKQDANKDGKLTLAEAQAAVRQWFTTLDKNKDGVLSDEERPMRGHRRGKGHPRGGNSPS